MQLKEGRIADILDPDDRAIARLANLARVDTIWGGCRALVLAERVERGDPVDFDAQWAERDVIRQMGHEVVAEVYSRSNYTCGRFGCYKCPECGQSWLGGEKTQACCNEEET